MFQAEVKQITFKFSGGQRKKRREVVSTAYLGDLGKGCWADPEGPREPWPLPRRNTSPAHSVPRRALETCREPLKAADLDWRVGEKG